MTTLNITKQNIAGDCSLKCQYFYDYQNSSTTATNGGFSINLTYDKSNVQPVIYNTNKYDVDTIAIYSPSLHFFDDRAVNAELIITHKPVSSGPAFYIGIPIVASTDTNSASSLLKQIIMAVSAGAPAQGESTNINISNFNLNTFIRDKTPFYSYTQDSSNWIVFGKENSINISQDILNRLGQIIKPKPGLMFPSGPEIFYNSTGAIKGFNSSDQIYIDCQPVTSSDEKIDVENIKSPITFDLMNNPTAIFIFQIVISCILFIIFLFLIHHGIKYIANINVSLPKIGNISLPKLGNKRT